MARAKEAESKFLMDVSMYRTGLMHLIIWLRHTYS